jgi:tetratricopeptide (TPR) repeat protein
MPLNLQRFLAPALALLIFSLGQGQPRNLERADLIKQPPVELTRLLEHINRLQVDSQRRPKDAPLKVQLAEAQIKSGQLTQAEKTLKTALRAEPGYVPAFILLGRLHLKRSEFDKAFEILGRVEKMAPEDLSVRLLAAGLALYRMDYSAAAAIYKAALRQNPRGADALFGLALVDYYENRFEEAEQRLNLCLDIDPALAQAWLLKAQIHRGRQENTEYAACVRKAVASDPLDDAARTVLATLLTFEEKKLDEGHAEARLALQLNPYSGAHNAMGNGLSARVYPELSIPLEEKKKQELLDAMKNGDSALINQNLSPADAAFDEALKLLPGYIPALVGKGAVQYHRENYDRALDWFFQALNVDPDYGLAHYGVSMCLARKKDTINVRLEEIERRFAAADAPEPSALRDVFINYANFDPEMQKIIRLSVQPLRAYLPLLKEKQATYYIFPFHHFHWQAPHHEWMKGRRTFDGRLQDDVKGDGGRNASCGAELVRDVKYLRVNILTHEFAHQVHSLLPQELKDEIFRLYFEATKNRRTLDYYADSNEQEYFAQGVEAYVSEEKLPDQKITNGHTRKELQQRDPALYNFIQKLAQVEK